MVERPSTPGQASVLEIWIAAVAAAAAKSLESCPTLRDPMDCSPPGSSVQGIFQARRVLEWGAIAFSLGSLLPLKLPRFSLALVH